MINKRANNRMSEQHRRFLRTMDDLNHCKARARAAGFAGNKAVLYPSDLRNGQVVEIAMCHMLGVVQRYVDYQFSIYTSRELDMKGVDVKVVTPYGTKNVQMKHSGSLGGRVVGKGEYYVPVEAGGYRIMYNFFKYYRLPWPNMLKQDYLLFEAELDFVFLQYTKGMYY